MPFIYNIKCCLAENVFTYYINTRINYYIGREEKPNDAKHQLYKELSQFTTKETTALAMTIVQIHHKIEQYANKNYPISTKNTRECVHNLEINHEENQQKLGIPAQTPKKNVIQSVKKQCLHSAGFENCEEESESESEETSEKTSTRPVTRTSSQFRNQETHDQEEEPDIREATFRGVQGNIIPLFLRPINPPTENNDEMTTPYIARLMDFSGEKEETNMYTWLREAQKVIQANNWNDQRAIQILSFFLKGTADS
ncbi:hypothetical protein G9A89_020213 [Geosiphon pyriformis]|nr:hypothetical protein G9A89_020213 [Geosiphon pyriformis]